MTDLKVSSVTKKGQFTIPKALREKYGIKDKIMIEEDERGIIIKPLLSPKEEFGSLKGNADGKTSKELLDETRAYERH
ncbi:MAG: AbrB/MazE/SpoVT family DNA-binding domain-containing protein [Candidatus Bathyarchaeia archaeon]|jgi:AbrB family looped-hinge helix DNA binding protein